MVMAISKLTIEQLAMIAIILDEEEEECPKTLDAIGFKSL